MEHFPEPTGISLEDTEIAFQHQSDTELRHSFWLFKMINNRVLGNFGSFLARAALQFRLPVKGVIKNTLFKQFCGGETIQACIPTIEKLAKGGVGTILDYAIEAGSEERAFNATAAEIIHTIQQSASMPDKIPFCVFKMSGVSRAGLLEKISQQGDLKAVEQLEWKKAQHRVDMICETAAELERPVLIDAEESWIQPVIDDLVMSMMLKYNKQKAIVFNTYQLYRRDKLISLMADTNVAKTRRFILGAKLVRGAYLEKEQQRALEKGYESPIHTEKAATDADYNAALSFCLENIHQVAFIAGTHNQQSCQFLIDEMDAKEIQNNHLYVYFSQLYGMGDHLSFNLAAAEYNVAKYVPYGPVKSVIPYLLRRAEENKAIAGQAGRELSLIKEELERRGV